MQSSTTQIPSFEDLEITGDIYLEPVPADVKIPPSSVIFLIMGPTGAGKSTFIEALSGASQNLQISKNQLAGYTQDVTAYLLINVHRHNWPVYLVDSPGFSDPQISETEIMEMVRNGLTGHGVSFIDRILFLIPITQPRLAGSKRRTIEMLKGFLKRSNNLYSTIFVTTMWNQLQSERSKQRAESSFAQLTNEILKEFIDGGSKIQKFTNTRNSALQILDITYTAGVPFSAHTVSREPLYLYRDLHERIEGALQQKKTLESYLGDLDIQTNLELKSILQKNHRENEEMLAKFIGQFVRFGKLPVDLEDTAQGLRRRVADEATPVNSRYKEIFDFWVNGVDQAVLPEDLYLDPPPRPLALIGVLRRVLKASMQRGSKWFKRGA